MSNNRMIQSSASKRWHDVAFWGIIVVACAVFWRMNVLTPFKEDDMAYSLVGHGSFMEFLRSRYEHFMTTNGRFSDTVSTIFCSILGKPLFNVCNTLVFGGLLYLLSLLSTKRCSVLAVTLFLAFVGYSYPVPGETMLFLSGSCNYLWGITASLLLVYYLQRQNGAPLGPAKSVLLFIGAFVAGNFNEATSMGMFAGMILYYLFNRDRFNKTVALALAGYLAGVLVTISSPAAWNRAANGDIVINLGFTDLLSSRCYIFAVKLIRHVVPVAALAVGFVTLLWKGLKPIKQNLWAYVMLCLALVMFALGSLGERAYSPLATVSFIIVAMAADYLLKRWRWARAAIIALGLAVTVYTGNQAMKDISAYKVYEDHNFNEIASAPSQAVLLEREFNTNSRFVTALRYFSNGYFVREDIYRKFFGKENVQFVSDSVYERYNSHRLLDGAVAMPLTTNHQDAIGTFYCFPDQEYMVAQLNTDTLPFSSQQVRYYNAPGNKALTPDEIAYRRKYGLVTEYNVHGFYPLRYEGDIILVFPFMNNDITHAVFPLNESDPSDEVTISWASVPNDTTETQR